MIERWRRAYNQVRPHSALAYRPLAPEARALTEQVASQLDTHLSESVVFGS
jgi:transposase InsO family protein